MEIANYELIELSNDEMNDIEGGFLPMLLGAIAICGAIYGAGNACSQALYYATH